MQNNKLIFTPLQTPNTDSFEIRLPNIFFRAEGRQATTNAIYATAGVILILGLTYIYVNSKRR